jgi:hypothetical protein
MHRKGFTPLIALLLIGTLGLSGLLLIKNSQLRQKPTIPPNNNISPTVISNNWKTYTNNKYEYSFNYLESPEITLLTCGSKPNDFYGEEIIIITSTSSTIGSKVCFPLEGISPIQIYTSQGNKSSEAEISNDPFYETKTEPVVIGGLEGIKATKTLKDLKESESGLLPTRIVETRVYKNESTYYLVTSFKEFEDIYDQILLTFRFINSPVVKCAGPENLTCPTGMICQVNVLGDLSEGGICVPGSEEDVNHEPH